MTNYVRIDDIKDARWKSYAEKIDGRKPDTNSPNDVGDAGDGKLSEREIKKLEQMILEYYTANPQKDSLGVEVPAGKKAADAMNEIFGGAFNYLKYQADQTFKSVGRFFAKLI